MAPLKGCDTYQSRYVLGIVFNSNIRNSFSVRFDRVPTNIYMHILILFLCHRSWCWPWLMIYKYNQRPTTKGHIFFYLTYLEGQPNGQAFKTTKTTEISPASLIGHIMNPFLNLFVMFKLILAALAMNTSSGNKFPVLLMGVERVVGINTM